MHVDVQAISRIPHVCSFARACVLLGEGPSHIDCEPLASQSLPSELCQIFQSTCAAQSYLLSLLYSTPNLILFGKVQCLSTMFVVRVFKEARHSLILHVYAVVVLFVCIANRRLEEWQQLIAGAQSPHPDALLVRRTSEPEPPVSRPARRPPARLLHAAALRRRARPPNARSPTVELAGHRSAPTCARSHPVYTHVLYMYMYCAVLTHLYLEFYGCIKSVDA